MATFWSILSVSVTVSPGATEVLSALIVMVGSSAAKTAGTRLSTIANVSRIETIFFMCSRFLLSRFFLSREFRNISQVELADHQGIRNIYCTVSVHIGSCILRIRRCYIAQIDLADQQRI